MQDGDLASYNRPRTVIVIEGVLAQVTPITEKRRFRADRERGYHINWYDVPLKRCAYMKQHWPETAQDFVTFISEQFLDTALAFLSETHIPFDMAAFIPFNSFTQTLRYQDDVIRVFDSDPDRLDRYGQKGVAVVPGNDF